LAAYVAANTSGSIGEKLLTRFTGWYSRKFRAFPTAIAPGLFCLSVDAQQSLCRDCSLCGVAHSAEAVWKPAVVLPNRGLTKSLPMLNIRTVS
jgi:hypothetical protein